MDAGAGRLLAQKEQQLAVSTQGAGEAEPQRRAATTGRGEAKQQALTLGTAVELITGDKW